MSHQIDNLTPHGVKIVTHIISFPSPVFKIFPPILYKKKNLSSHFYCTKHTEIDFYFPSQESGQWKQIFLLFAFRVFIFRGVWK